MSPLREFRSLTTRYEEKTKIEQLSRYYLYCSLYMSRYPEDSIALTRGFLSVSRKKCTICRKVLPAALQLIFLKK